MKELVEYIVKSLVDSPQLVELQETVNEADQSVLIEVRVAPADMGKVIGKQGKIAKSIRTVAKAAAAKEGKRIAVEIIN